LVCGSRQGRVNIHKTGEDFPLVQFLDHHTNNVMALAFSKNGSLLASAGRDRVVVLDASSSFNLIADLNNHASEIMAVSFAPNLLWFLSGHADGSIIVVMMTAVSEFMIVATTLAALSYSKAVTKAPCGH
jgi:WD40 repeat protein